MRLTSLADALDQARAFCGRTLLARSYEPYDGVTCIIVDILDMEW